MKKILMICTAAMVLAGMSNAANAVTIRKAGTNMVLSGPVTTTIAGGAPTVCTVTAVYDVPAVTDTGAFAHPLGTDPSHGHAVTLKSFSMGGSPACSLAKLTGTPTISVTASTVTISGINATAIGGLITCSGSITGAYNHALAPNKSSVDFVNQTIGACTFSGTITAQNVGEFDIDATH